MFAIPVWRYEKGPNRFVNILGKCITYFTGYPYTHVGIIYFGKLYESTIWLEDGKLRSGIRVRGLDDPSIVPPAFCMVPWRTELTPTMLYKIGDVLDRYIRFSRPYNVFKLIVLSFVWPTRWFWKAIKWVPFHHEVFGTVCSTFVDRVMHSARWDLFPDEWESYTVPGQFATIAGWRAERCMGVGGGEYAYLLDDIGD